MKVSRTAFKMKISRTIFLFNKIGKKPARYLNFSIRVAVLLFKKKETN